MNKPESSNEFLTRSLHGVKAQFLNLHALIATAEHVSEVFPIWNELRTLELELACLTNEAGDRCEALLEKL